MCFYKNLSTIPLANGLSVVSLRAKPTITLNVILHICSTHRHNIAGRCMTTNVAIKLRDSQFLNKHALNSNQTLAVFSSQTYLRDVNEEKLKECCSELLNWCKIGDGL